MVTVNNPNIIMSSHLILTTIHSLNIKKKYSHFRRNQEAKQVKAASQKPITLSVEGFLNSIVVPNLLINGITNYAKVTVNLLTVMHFKLRYSAEVADQWIIFIIKAFRHSRNGRNQKICAWVMVISAQR
jgi:hypothetical protein